MCLTPIRVKAKKTIDGMVAHSGHQIVPCGKCPKCKLKRANAWILRLLHEEKAHQNALFITLTYDPEHARLTKKGYMTLCKRDVQLFMKRLRFNTKRTTIKYYFCGEYGTDTWRPHYHAIIYDCTYDEIEKAWGLGHIYVGQVTGASIGYTTKYICKDRRVPAHANDDRIPEFSLMSQNLGLAYITPQTIKYHVNNMASYMTVEGGYKKALPRYYRDKIFTEQQRLELNEMAQYKHRLKFEEAIKQAGSVKDFYRNQFEYVALMKHLSNSQTEQKRNKI